MNSLIVLVLALFLPLSSANAANDAMVETLFMQPYTGSVLDNPESMANRVRICQRVMTVGTDTEYVLQCLKRTELTHIQERMNLMRLFFADPAIIDVLMGTDTFLYIHVLSDVQTPGMASRTCYRVVREVDAARDGYYAVQVCENN